MIEVTAVVAERGGWWRFTLPGLPAGSVRPGRGPVTPGGQATSRAGALKGAAEIASLILDAPLAGIAVRPVTPAQWKAMAARAES